ncbi:MAG TPA: acetyl-CoA hydrolase/transferase C-terminal domain-containing protein [Amycolatopsis sp.]|nr:acetyl-CoA hydrolase/transferase C-terminal domain-containing protein [Amycolatopsis sp.]
MATVDGQAPLAGHLRPGDLVVVEQGVGEPAALVERLVAESDALTGIEIFFGLSYTGLATESLARKVRLSSFGAMAALAPLAPAGLLEIVPCHYADVSRMLRVRGGDALVVLIQVSPADADGYHSLGVAVDYSCDLLDQARVVIAEVNDRMPVTSAPKVHGSRFAATVHTSRPVHTVPTPSAGDLHRRIAETAAELVPSGAALQLGIGAVPSVVGGLLADRRDLRVHSALVGDWLLELARAGALSDEPGSVVVGGAAGSRELYEYLASSGAEFRPVAELSPPGVLAGVDRLVAMNSALQVDLTGQVNAEVAGTRYLGGIGGQLDFLRGAQLSRDGRSIVMLPATAVRGTKSRIVRELDQGTVTTPRSCVDFIITEYGCADLRGKALTERAEALIAIAAPEHRDALAGEAALQGLAS